MKRLHRPILRAGAGGYGFIRSLNPVAWYRADTGVTVTGTGASMVADQADADNALVLPGIAGNYASAPDSVPLSITGDIDIRVKAALADWTPSAASILCCKLQTGTERSFRFAVNTSGNPYLEWSEDGSATITATSSAATSVTDGATKWVRVTLDVDNGSAGNDTKFYLSDDGESWTQLGTTQTKVGTTSIYNSTSIVEVGASVGGTSGPVAGRIYRAIIKNGIDGTTVFDANFAAQTKGTTSFSESSSNAATVTVNQSGALPAHIGNQKDLLQGTDANRPPYLSYSGTKYLYLPGVAGNYASTPDSVAASVTGSIDIRVRLSLPDWTPTNAMYFIAKDTAAGTRGYAFFVNGTGSGSTLRLLTSPDGATVRSAASTVAPSFTDGTAYWIRVTKNTATGVVTFYTAADSATEPTSWTQLGNTVASSAEASNNDTNALSIGADAAGTNSPLDGKIYRAIIKSGIDGTTVVDFNPDLDGSDQAATITSSATGEIWTINKSGGLPAQIVATPRLLGDGSGDKMATNAYVADQPRTRYIVCQAISWTAGDYLISGTGAEAGVTQVTATPQIGLNAGSAAAANSGLVLNEKHVVCAVLDGADSLLQIDLDTPSTGNAGTNDPDGIALFANQAGSGYFNGMVWEILDFYTAHDATQRARVIKYCAGRHGIAL